MYLQAWILKCSICNVEIAEVGANPKIIDKVVLICRDCFARILSEKGPAKGKEN